MNEPTKQVIVMRRDLKMRRGKEIAQGSHASMAFIIQRLENFQPNLAEKDWLEGIFAKICVRVNSEEELMDIYEKAKEAGLEVHLITDAGKTEFHGEPTKTCLAIGPDYASKIDPITSGLSLL